MARMGDWRDNKDIEIPLDGVGGVSIVVKADVHREGMSSNHHSTHFASSLTSFQASTSPPTLSKTKPRPKVSLKWPSVQASKCSACPITSSGTETPTRSPVTLKESCTNGEGFLAVSIDRIFVAYFVLVLLSPTAIGDSKTFSRLAYSFSSLRELLFVLFCFFVSPSRSRPAVRCFCVADMEFECACLFGRGVFGFKTFQ